MSCGRAQEFLAQNHVDVAERVDASKGRLGAREALALCAKATDIYVAKGKKLVHVDMKNAAPKRDELLSLLLGPTGNLRAPTLRKGSTLLVGFNPDTYEDVLLIARGRPQAQRRV